MTDKLGSNYWKLWIASVISNLGDGMGVVAYPWLASAITRSPLHIAAVAVATRIPWLLFSLPAGVITDRVDRRKLASWMDVIRFGITLALAFVVLAAQPGLSSPDQIAAGTAPIPPNATFLLVAVYLASLLLGSAEVLRDNSAQTLLPAIVEKQHLEKANGRLWGAEMVMNSFVGPPVGGLLLAIAFSLPFFVDAGSFAVAAALVFTIGGRFRPKVEAGTDRASFWADMKEGVRWLWGHPLFRPMAISLGVLNASSAAAMATFVLFGQEILGLDAARFGLITTGFAVGGVIGSFGASRAIKVLGQGGTLLLTVVAGGGSMVISGLTSSFWLFWAMGLVGAATGTLWNVVTVSLRQSLIPDRILGRVNSVYRFIGWGMIPIGSLLGGVVVVVVQPLVGREWALRSPFLLAAVASVALFAFVASRLSTARIEAARADAST